VKHSKPLFFAVLLLLTTGAIFAQGLTGTLTGVVTQEKTPLPGVTVTIASPNMQGTRTAVTNEAGGYNFGAVPPGDYRVTFELGGLQTIKKSAHVGVAQTANVDAAMKVAAVSEAITVTASAPAVAETHEVQANFTQQTIQQLPVNRNLVAIVSLAPGVMAGGVNGATISGGQSYDNLYMTDGAVIQENLRGQPHLLFIEDAIQETTIQTAGISAEFGNFTGGVVNAITKSGGNQFSGSLRDNLTNPKWTTKSPDAYTTVSGVVTTKPTPNPVSHIDPAYEGTLGGKIIQDRLWFFAAGRLAKRSSSSFFTNGGPAYGTTTTDKRQEGKLTGAITSKQNLVLSYVNAPSSGTQGCQIGCYDSSALYPTYSNPNSFLTAFYNGVLTNNLMAEAKFTRKVFQFVGYGGQDSDRVTGTPLYLASPGYAAMTNESYFCGTCGAEDRNNKQYGAKLNYFLGTKSLGNHSIVAGIDRWHENRLSNNYQTASGYVMYAVTLAPTRDAAGNTLVSIKGGTNDYFQYWPILESSLGSDLNTDSAYVNDKWGLNQHWEFNIGARFDKNDAADSAGNKVANDSKLSPRLGATYDVAGNGKLRLNASYGTYVGRLAETVAGRGSAAGNPAQFAYFYGGADIIKVGPTAAMQQIWAWVDAQGGVSKLTPFFQNIPGATSRIQGSLKSPNVQEMSLGASTTFGAGFLRADLIHRDWKDFYGQLSNISMAKSVTLPSGAKADLTLVDNTNEFSRKYNGLDLQGSYRLLNRIDVGANYTYSTLKGNIVGETSGGGPVASGGSQDHPEYYGFAQNNPSGYLAGDQRHKLRAWAGLDMPSPVGLFNLSVLERFDSGSPYSLAGTIDIRSNANFYGTGLPGGVVNPGYVTPPTTEGYYFSSRGAYHTPNITATDISLNYNTTPSWLRGLSFFAQAQLINALNENGLVSYNASVLTAYNDSTLKRFNPLAGDVPVEGVNWKKGPLFGKPTSATNSDVQGSFQLPRTYRFNVGIRF